MSLIKSSTPFRRKDRVYHESYDYSKPGTYIVHIKRMGIYRIILIGGGGGSAQTDGGADDYSDTSGARHYGHNGAFGGTFIGYAALKPGTLTIVVGDVGTNCAGKGVAAGNGGDSYAAFAYSNELPVEIARAGGGHSGYPEGSSFTVDTPGGKVTYNNTYFAEIAMAKDGEDGKFIWS